MKENQIGKIFGLILVLFSQFFVHFNLCWYEVVFIIAIFIWLCYDCWKLENYIDELEIYRNSGLKLTLSKEEELIKAKNKIKELEIRRLK